MSSNKISAWSRIIDFFSPGQPEGIDPPIPQWYMIDVGNLCNLRCPFCPTGKNIRGIERGLLPLEQFDVILKKIAPHARFVNLINWGEAFLNKEILHLFRRCADLGIKTHIDSNLSVKAWSEEEAEQIVLSGIDVILASIDGVTQEAYSRYRVNGNLEMALNNLRLLKKTRDRLRHKTPFLGWSFYINKFNEHEVEQARALAAEMGVGIWFKLLSCEDPAWLSSYHDNPASPVLATPRWVQDVYPDLRADTVVKKPLPPALPHVCSQPFSCMVIDWNGNIYPCCTVYGENFKLGNLLEQDLSEIWSGENYRNCRSFLRNYGPRQNSHSVCQNNPCPLSAKEIAETANM